MRRKLIATMLTAILVMSVTACGNAGNSGSTDTQPTETQSVQDNETAEGETTEEGIVQTTAGKVQGAIEDGIYRYLGVPYAQSSERFVPAEEVTPWNDVLVADEYGPISHQGAILGMDTPDQDGTDNNCQNLNIWTPGINDGKKRPVMVWLHGGGFAMGSANDEMYDGANLSSSGDAVVVSVNHRLNVFGYLDLSAYGDKYKYSANAGLTDIVASLQWLRDNVEMFGGDPDNITVFGQSGGGAKVLSLMTTPYAEGLFHKGIVESGATETMGVTFTSKEASAKVTERTLENLNISTDNIEELQDVSVADLQEASNKALQDTAQEFEIPASLADGYAMEWGPVIDGDYMPTNPVTEDSFAEAGNDIPLLIGSNLNEWTTMMPSAAQQNMTEEAIAAYEAAYPNEDSSAADKVDTFIRLPMLKIMSHKADQGGADVYAYVFTYGDEAMGSYHGAEIPFVFNNTTGDDATQKLAETVSQAWINFARTGIPAAEALPTWEAYDRQQGATMLLGTESELVYNHDKELMSLLVPDYQY